MTDSERGQLSEAGLILSYENEPHKIVLLGLPETVRDVITDDDMEHLRPAVQDLHDRLHEVVIRVLRELKTVHDLVE